MESSLNALLITLGRIAFCNGGTDVSCNWLHGWDLSHARNLSPEVMEKERGRAETSEVSFFPTGGIQWAVPDMSAAS